MRAELAILGAARIPFASGDGGDDIEAIEIAGVPYLRFESAPLDQAALDVLANMSATMAVFERADGLLRPIEVHPLQRFDDDLLTIPKYSGKTNEQFTKLLVNVTDRVVGVGAGAGSAARSRSSIRSPGRGTTLDLALTYGFDAAGIEIEEREVDAYATFLGTYLKRKRLKHTMEYAPVRRDGKRIGKRLTVEVNPDAEAYKRGERQSLVVHCANTVAAAELFGKRRFDAVVADAPYGVVHGSRAGTPDRERDRSPAGLLAAAIPVWSKLIRPGGALGLAWNSIGLDRGGLIDMLAGAGLDALDDGAVPAVRPSGRLVDPARRRRRPQDVGSEARTRTRLRWPPCPASPALLSPTRLDTSTRGSPSGSATSGFPASRPRSTTTASCCSRSPTGRRTWRRKHR